MSKIICASAIDGARDWIAKAEERLNHAIGKRGETWPAAFPGTAYFLPIIYSFTGEPVRTLGELRPILRQAKELLPLRPADNVKILVVRCSAPRHFSPFAPGQPLSPMASTGQPSWASLHWASSSGVAGCLQTKE